jgi:hypothetical protein
MHGVAYVNVLESTYSKVRYSSYSPAHIGFFLGSRTPEPILLNVYGAPELIPRNEFRQPMQPGGPVR